MVDMINRAILRYLKKHYPTEWKKIAARARRIRPKMMKRAPDLGGRENSLANNLDMFILFISYYEASDRRMDGAAIDEIIDDIYRHLRFVRPLMNINNPTILSVLRKYLYNSYRKHSEKVKAKKAQGQWLDTWDMVVNPNNTDVGVAFTLVGCPLAEYAKKYGYMDIMPHMCAIDHAYAKLMHAKLLRTHTVATGSDSCDYWYVPDKSVTARRFKGKIV